VGIRYGEAFYAGSVRQGPRWAMREEVCLVLFVCLIDF
jgi:hypothetical protein